MFLFCVLVSSDELAQRQQSLTPICCKLTSDSCLLASIPRQEINLQSTKRVISHLSQLQPRVYNTKLCRALDT